MTGLDQVKVFEFNPDTIDERSLMLLTDLLTFTEAKVVVEAGTYLGNFSLTASRLATLVYTADPHDYGWTGLLDENGITNVVFVQDDFEEIATRHPEVVGRVDFAFIDSGPRRPFEGEEVDHGMRYRHYKAAKRWARSGGLVVVDDVNANDWYGVHRIRAEAGLVLLGGRGLSVWQKP